METLLAEQTLVQDSEVALNLAKAASNAPALATAATASQIEEDAALARSLAESDVADIDLQPPPTKLKPTLPDVSGDEEFARKLALEESESADDNSWLNGTAATTPTSNGHHAPAKKKGKGKSSPKGGQWKKGGGKVVHPILTPDPPPPPKAVPPPSHVLPSSEGTEAEKEFQDHAVMELCSDFPYFAPQVLRSLLEAVKWDLDEARMASLQLGFSDISDLAGLYVDSKQQQKQGKLPASAPPESAIFDQPADWAPLPRPSQPPPSQPAQPVPEASRKGLRSVLKQEFPEVSHSVISDILNQTDFNPDSARIALTEISSHEPLPSISPSAPPAILFENVKGGLSGKAPSMPDSGTLDFRTNVWRRPQGVQAGFDAGSYAASSASSATSLTPPSVSERHLKTSQQFRDIAEAICEIFPDVSADIVLALLENMEPAPDPPKLLEQLAIVYPNVSWDLLADQFSTIVGSSSSQLPQTPPLKPPRPAPNAISQPPPVPTPIPSLPQPSTPASPPGALPPPPPQHSDFPSPTSWTTWLASRPPKGRGISSSQGATRVSGRSIKLQESEEREHFRELARCVYASNQFRRMGNHVLAEALHKEGQAAQVHLAQLCFSKFTDSIHRGNPQIDLHWLTWNFARRVLEEVIQEMRRVNDERASIAGSPRLSVRVITGRGVHSNAGIAVLYPRTRQFLEEAGIRFNAEAGSYIVSP